MKIYIFYLSLPDGPDMIDEFPEDDVLDYNEVQYVNKLNKSYDVKSGRWTYLYAWTDNKEYARAFAESHDDKLFTMVKRKISEDDYYDFRRHFPEAILMKYNYYENINSRGNFNSIGLNEKEKDEYYLIAPTFEILDFGFIAESWLSNLLMNSLSAFPYDLIKTKYLEALDKVGVTTISEEITDPEAAYDRESYNVSPLGYANGQFWRPNLLAVYCKLFRLLLTKDTKERKCEDDDL